MPVVKVVYGEAETSISFDSPNTLIKEILEKAKASFSIPTAKSNFELQYKQKPVDLLLPFRLSGVLANSSLELVAKPAAKTSEARSGGGSVQLALDFGPGRKRIETSAASVKTLHDVISEIAGGEQVTAARFMNRKFEREQFANVTLESLGLVQGSALIRLEGAQTPTIPENRSAQGSEEKQETSGPTPFQDLDSVDAKRLAALTLMKLVRNVLVNSEDERVRSIRMSNPAIKGKLRDSPTAINYLTRAGFQATERDGESFMILNNPDENVLRSIFNELSKIGLQFGVEPQDIPSLSSEAPRPSPAGPQFEFDPFRTNVIGMGSSNGPTFRLESAGIATLEQQVQELKARRDNIMQRSATVEDRKLVALAYSSDFNPRRFVAEEENDDPEDSNGSTEKELDIETRVAISEHFRHVQERQKKAENFQTRAMREYDILSKSKVYTRTLIRIVFPDRSIVQALFSPVETVGAVCAVLVDACPVLRTTEFNLVTGPPPQRLDPAQTLETLGLVPAASLQLSCVPTTNLVIRPELFSADSSTLNVRVPKGEPLVPSMSRVTAATGGVPSAAGRKPKWLKL